MNTEDKQVDRFWRIFLCGTKVSNVFSRKICEVCFETQMKDSHCCWLCENLPECYEKWLKSYPSKDSLEVAIGKNCPYEAEGAKICLSVAYLYAKFRGKKDEQKKWRNLFR
jgi:hypothetical protein